MRGGGGGGGRGGRGGRYVDMEAGPVKRRRPIKEFFDILTPYFWPAGLADRGRAVSCFLSLGLSKACNIMGPLFLGIAIDDMAGRHGDPTMPTLPICLFVLMRFGTPLFAEVQRFTYLGVKEVAYRQIASRTFRHLHSLSLNWHLSKRTGVVLRSIDRGSASASNVVEYLFLRLAPTFVELFVLCIILFFRFDAGWSALVIFAGFMLYTVMTFTMTNWRRKIRNRMHKQDNEASQKALDSLTNFETVKYFTNEDFELANYAAAIRKFQRLNYNTQRSLIALNLSQQLVINLSLLGVLILSARDVVYGGQPVSHFVILNTYTYQVFAPLGFLGTIYSIVVNAFTDMTNLSDLLNESPDVVDIKGARDLVVPDKGAAIEFEDVVFEYPRQKANLIEQRSAKNTGDSEMVEKMSAEAVKVLRGISFRVEPGTTTAIVGHTGAGKSTISRLLFRFYDTTSGVIRIGGEDVKALKQRSLRSQIGMVPQDTVLFNETIKYNIRYGKTDATDEEIDAAVKDAQVQEILERLPNGYDTMVGERGLKLSGGEKQRVAIARTLLKDPPMLVLDEATSALDSITEHEIQTAINRVRKGRTVVVIAHRLSTIRDSEQIIVLRDGVVSEKGTHDELMALEGEYYTMWQRQVEGTAGHADDGDAPAGSGSGEAKPVEASAVDVAI